MIIGQAPGPRTDPKVPLSGRCGARLAALCGLTLDEFLDRFHRVNLIERFPGKQAKGDAFPIDEARRGAIRLLTEGWLDHRWRVVLLGGNVVRTFGLAADLEKPLAFYTLGFAHGGAAYCPHPSGVNRWWNDPANERAARKFWRALCTGSRG